MYVLFFVITGPIANGKSTVARFLARELEQRGAVVAAIDLDVLCEMVENTDAPRSAAVKWLRARRLAATLTERFLADGINVVIVEGEFLTSEDREALVASLPPESSRAS